MILREWRDVRSIATTTTFMITTTTTTTTTTTITTTTISTTCYYPIARIMTHKDIMMLPRVCMSNGPRKASWSSRRRLPLPAGMRNERRGWVALAASTVAVERCKC